MSEREGPRPLVLDTSVAVKFYLPEDLREEALTLLAAVGEEIPDLLAPSTVQPEFFNALWQQHRRGKLTREEVRRFWGEFVADDPASLYAPEDLMPRAAEIAVDSGVIVYDALFLALAENTNTVTVTADGTLLKALEGTDYSRLAHPLADVNSLVAGAG